MSVGVKLLLWFHRLVRVVLFIVVFALLFSIPVNKKLNAVELWLEGKLVIELGIFVFALLYYFLKKQNEQLTTVHEYQLQSTKASGQNGGLGLGTTTTTTSAIGIGNGTVTTFKPFHYIRYYLNCLLNNPRRWTTVGLILPPCFDVYGIVICIVNHDERLIIPVVSAVFFVARLIPLFCTKHITFNPVVTVVDVERGDVDNDATEEEDDEFADDDLDEYNMGRGVLRGQQKVQLKRSELALT